LIHDERDGFTSNRMVNQLSASQEMRMLRKSLEELDEKTIASALGMQGIGHRLNKGLLGKLHPNVVKAFNASKIELLQIANYQLQICTVQSAICIHLLANTEG
jgi:hypothetical protein